MALIANYFGVNTILTSWDPNDQSTQMVSRKWEPKDYTGKMINAHVVQGQWYCNTTASRVQISEGNFGFR